MVASITTHLETRVSRALLDARTGTLVETANPRYVVTDAMRQFVAARDVVCRMWGCNRQVWRGSLDPGADMDHAVPWPAGPSSTANLSGLCRHHHLLKHSPRWAHVLHPDGATEWVSPGGIEAMTFPAHWVHTDDEDATVPDDTVAPSPPSEGAKELASLFAAIPPF